MGRGLIVGANLLVFTAIIGSCFFAFSPMWLVERTELKQSFCWSGDGIWWVGYTWGQDIKEDHIDCSSIRGGKSLSTYDAYCKNELEEESDGYNQQMCDSTNAAKVLSILSIIFTTLPLIFVSLKHFTIEHGALNRSIKGFAYMVAAASSAFIGSTMTIATIGVMLHSPLFSDNHQKILSESLHGMPYNGYECVFQTPLYSIFTILSSAPLKCLMPGQALSAALMKLIASTLATLFYALEAKDLWGKRNANFTSRILLSTMVNSAAGLVPDVHTLPRNYSMFGAFSRKFEGYGKILMHALVSGLPYIVMICNAVCWALFIYTGVQVIVFTEVAIKYPPKSSSAVEDNLQFLAWDDKRAADYWAETCLSDPSMPRIPDHMDRYEAHDMLKTLVQFLVGKGERLSVEGILDEFGDYYPIMDNKEVQDDGILGKTMKKWKILTIFMNIFDYSPITSLKFFWDGGAGLVAVAQFLAVLVWPISKVIAWIYLFFVPMDEVIRGRMLSWIDTLGKWTLANIYVLVLMGASNTFERVITLPWIILPGIIPRGGSLDVTISVNICEGLGSISFVLSNVFSLLIGQIILLSHRYNKTWEEERRQQQAKSWIEGEQDEQELDDPYAQTNSTAFSSNAYDTPFIGEHNIGLLPPPTIPIKVIKANDNKGDDQHGQSPKKSKFKLDITNVLHPNIEAMHDRIHSPFHGHHYRWSPLGKVVIWIFIFITVGMQLIVQSIALIKVEKKGFVGQLIVAPEDHVTYYSLISLTEGLWISGYPIPLASIAITYFVFTVMFPVLHCVFLALMWTIPMTIEQQSGVFYALEITGAWDALDVFIIALAAVLIEAEAVVGNLVNLTVPKLAELLRIFGFKLGVVSAVLSIEPGFWILIFTVALQKLLNYFILEQAACALSERRAEVALIEWSQDKSPLSFSPLALRGISKLKGSALAAATAAHARGGISPSSFQPGRRNTLTSVTQVEVDVGGEQQQQQHFEIHTPNLGEYVERVLETSAAGIFSPGNRYISSMFPKKLYAGLPRSFWKRLHQYKMLEEVDLNANGVVCLLPANSIETSHDRHHMNEDETILSTPFALDSNIGGNRNRNNDDHDNDDFTIGDEEETSFNSGAQTISSSKRKDSKILAKQKVKWDTNVGDDR